MQSGQIELRDQYDVMCKQVIEIDHQPFGNSIHLLTVPVTQPVIGYLGGDFCRQPPLIAAQLQLSRLLWDKIQIRKC